MSGKLLTRCAVIIAFASVLAVILPTPVPPLLDYPNHLARFWLLSGGDKSEPVSQMYRIDWSRASTNIGIDLLVTFLSELLPYNAVGRMVACIALVGPPAAALVLSAYSFRRLHWWQASLPMLTWTTTALAGFLSYQFALTIALLCAPFVAARGWGSRAVLLGVACGGLVLLFHPFGLVLLAAILVGLAVGPEWNGLFQRAKLVRVAQGVGIALLSVAVPVSILYVAAPVAPGGHTAHDGFVINWLPFTLRNEMLTALSPFLSYDRTVDMLLLLPLLAVCAWAAAAGRLRVHAGLVIVGGLLGVLSLVMPMTVGDASLINRRLPLMAALLLLAGVQPDPLRRTVLDHAMVALVVLLVAGKSLWVASLWSAREREVQMVKEAIAPVPPGASVFVLQMLPNRDWQVPPGRYLAGFADWRTETVLRHMPALVVPLRHAFIPTLFSVPGQQPLVILPPWSRLAVTSSLVPNAHVLEGRLSPEVLKADPYLRTWQSDFDYVVLLGVDQGDAADPFRPPPELTLVYDSSYARLYRITHESKNSSLGEPGTE